MTRWLFNNQLFLFVGKVKTDRSMTEWEHKAIYQCTPSGEELKYSFMRHVYVYKCVTYIYHYSALSVVLSADVHTWYILLVVI